MAHIREYTESDYAAVVAVADGLPEWFDEHARHAAIPVDIRHQIAYVAVDDRVIVGFISLYVSEGKLNIGWIGVTKPHQRRGIGRQLLEKAEARARALGVPEIAVYTLGDSVEYPPYEQTRAFYFKNGFEVYQRSKTDNPGCPEELKLKKKL